MTPIVSPIVSIREATSADVDDICALIIGLAEYEQLALEVVWQRADIEAALFGPVPAAHVLLAVDDQSATTAGFALWYPTFSTFMGQRGIWLEDLFVKPEYRGHGLGKALLLHLARLANQRGCGRMEWAVLDWNQPAIKFYESIGAERKHDWTICRLTGTALAQYA